MQAAIATLIGVMGTGLITVFIHFLRSIPERIDRLEDKFEGHIRRLEDKVDDLRDDVHQGFREQGERIARLENPPDPDAPAEAA